MIKILYCTDNLLAGGMERNLTDLLLRLDRSEFQPEVICLYGPRAARTLNFAPQIRAANIPIHLLDVGLTPQGKLTAFTHILRLTWQLRPHILQAFTYHSNLLTRLARPFMPPLNLVAMQLTGTLSRKQLQYERWSWHLYTQMVYNSPHLERLLTQQAGVPTSRLVQIPNGIDLRQFANNPQPDFRQQIAPGASHIVLIVSRISPEKAPHLLVDAIARLKARNCLPEASIIILVGEKMSEAEQGKIEQLIHEHGLEVVVRQHSQTTDPTPYYHAADFTALVSYGEGLPNVVLESMAAGRPVIISEAANQAGLVQHELNGWVFRTGDAEHLSETLEHVFRLPAAHVASMRPACLATASQYTVENWAALHQQLYRQLVSRA
jgi:glycosyltransferase involved in cell wall biosynthesis